MHSRLRIEVKTELRVFKTDCFAALAATAIDQEVDSLPSKNNGAQGRNRTGTVLPPRDFKSLASTNFATWADDISILHPFTSLIAVVLLTTVYHNATWAGN